MPSMGSYFRFVIGILLGIEILRLKIVGELTSDFAFWMALIFVISSLLWIGMRFFIK